jgi:hypothetical protein
MDKQQQQQLDYHHYLERHSQREKASHQRMENLRVRRLRVRRLRVRLGQLVHLLDEIGRLVVIGTWQWQRCGRATSNKRMNGCEMAQGKEGAMS